MRKTISGTVTEYFYSGSVVVSEKQGSTWTDYIFFGSQRIAKQTGSTASTATYIHGDHLGSTRVCTNSSGNSAGTCDGVYPERSRREPFGEFQPGSACSGLPTVYRYAGMEYDSESGLYHTWFRQYDASQGRWMAVDPIPGSDGDPQSQDRYAYVTSDPVNLVDPWGLIHTRCFRLCFVDVVGYRFEGDHPSEPIGPIYDISRCSIFCLIERLGPGGPGGGLGIRAPGQTFGECVEQNAPDYSFAGLADLMTGANTAISDNVFFQAAAGNTFTSLYYSFAADNTAFNQLSTIGGSAPTITSRAMGSTLTVGRRTSDIIALNLAGKGGLPKALSSAALATKASISWLNSFKLTADAAFTLALVLGCLGPR